MWVTYKKPVVSPERHARAALKNATHLALRKPVTTSFPNGITHGKPALLTDGNLRDHLGHGTPGRAWAQAARFATVGLALKTYWYRLKAFFRGERPGQKDPEQGEPPADGDPSPER